MAIVVNSVDKDIVGADMIVSANIAIDAYSPQDFSVKVHAGATGKKATLGKKMKALVLAEKARLDEKASIQTAITITELQAYLNS